MTVRDPAIVQRDLEIAELSITPGNSYSDIAKLFNLSKGRISQILSKKDIRSIVRQGQQELVKYIPLAVDNYRAMLADKEHKDFYKASRDVLQNTDILASHTGGNVYIQNVFNSDTAPDEVEVNRFKDIIQGRQDADVVEGEIITDDTLKSVPFK